MSSALRVLPLLAVLGAWLPGCSHQPELEPIRVVESFGSLLDYRWQTEFAPENCAPGLGVLEPGVDRKQDSGVLPALLVRPDTRVSLRVPETAPAECGLEVAVGVDSSAFAKRANSAPAAARAKARIRMQVEVDGELVFESQFSLAEDTSHSERVWKRAEVRVRPGALIELVCSATELPPGPLPVCGFGLLELVVPRELARAPRDAAKPNLVLIVVDTLRADALSCQGGSAGATPQIDALAARGTRFERAYAPSSWTWPSTASLLTGLSPMQHGLDGPRANRLRSDLHLLSESMQSAGISTLGVSANPLVGRGRNFDQGFEEFIEIPDGPAGELVSVVTGWLEKRRDSRCFVYVHLMDPHGPYWPATAFRQRFAPSVPEDFDATPLTHSRESREALGDARRQELLAQARALYAGEVAQVDAAIGELLVALERLGLASNTLIALTADHGEEFLEHGHVGHAAQLHEESLRVPLVLAGPGIGRAVRPDAVELRLLGSTLLGRMGLPREGGLDGGDLLALPGARAAPYFASTELGRWPGEDEPRAIHAVLDGAWRLFFAPAAAELPERIALYDLDSDPLALRECSAEQLAQVQRLRALAQAWLAREASAERARLGTDRSSEALLQQLGYLGD